jgi:hypothetical protein
VVWYPGNGNSNGNCVPSSVALVVSRIPTYNIIFKCLAPVNYSDGTAQCSRRLLYVASGSSLVLPRAAADARGQRSTLRYVGNVS